MTATAYPKAATAIYATLSADATLETTMSTLAGELSLTPDPWPGMIREAVSPHDPINGAAIVFNLQGAADADVLFCGDTDSVTCLVTVKTVVRCNSIARLAGVADRIAALLVSQTITTGSYTVEFTQSGEVAYLEDAGAATYAHLGYLLSARVYPT